MASCQLHLYFTKGPAYELYRLRFRNAQGSEVTAVRGKSEGAHRGAASFQWTAAVRALSLLAVQSRLLGATDGALSGGRGSPAAALDYALGKPPRWLQELFGDQEKRIGRYFLRSNPELKQPGPVTVRFSERLIDQSAITIEVQGSGIDEHGDLSRLRDSLSGMEDGGDDLPTEEVALQRYLMRVVSEETLTSLSRVRFTSPGWCRDQLGALAGDTLFRRITRAPREVVQSLFPPNGSAERFAIRRELRLERALPNGLRVLSPSCQPGLISLAIFLRDFAGVPLDVDPYHLYGVELVERVLRENGSSVPTIISTGLGPSTPLLNDPRHGYKPIMLGPALSHRIVSAGSAAQAPIAELHMVSEQTTSAMFSLANFQRSGAVTKRHELRHTEPDEVMRHLAAGESLHALLWFPHNRFFPDFMGGTGMLAQRDEPYVDVTMIFGNEAITSNPLLLASVTAAIRHAWFALLESPPTISAIAAKIVHDADFYTYLKRALGLHYAPNVMAGAQPSLTLPRLDRKAGRASMLTQL